MKITEEQFYKILEMIEDRWEMTDELDDVFNKYHYINDWISGSFLLDAQYETIIVQLLEQMLDDTEHWISYWLYDLHCGWRYQPGDVLDENNNDIPLGTKEDLWVFLTKKAR